MGQHPWFDEYVHAQRNCDPMKHGGLVSLREAAEILGCGMSTLRTWDKDGSLKAVRTPGGQRRYRMEDLERFKRVGAQKTRNRKTVFETVKTGTEALLRAGIRFKDLHEVHRWFRNQFGLSDTQATALVALIEQHAEP